MPKPVPARVWAPRQPCAKIDASGDSRAVRRSALQESRGTGRGSLRRPRGALPGAGVSHRLVHRARPGRRQGLLPGSVHPPARVGGDLRGASEVLDLVLPHPRQLLSGSSAPTAGVAAAPPLGGGGRGGGGGSPRAGSRGRPRSPPSRGGGG